MQVCKVSMHEESEIEEVRLPNEQCTESFISYHEHPQVAIIIGLPEHAYPNGRFHVYEDNGASFFFALSLS